ncbi:MAG: hypothetical protein JKY65_18510 [Planctomycetes bacterium]|nr:hypothetical protein [Planctomycetota bacterium]
MTESTSGQPQDPVEGEEDEPAEGAEDAVYPIHRVALRGLLSLFVGGGVALVPVFILVHVTSDGLGPFLMVAARDLKTGLDLEVAGQNAFIKEVSTRREQEVAGEQRPVQDQSTSSAQ